MSYVYDKTHDALLYSDAPVPGLNYLGAEIIPVGSGFAVRRTLRNSQILRRYNYPVPPIIDADNYHWPIEPGRQPLAHQRIYANFSVLHPRMFNLGDAGTMKTLSTLWAADFLMRCHPPGTMRALVIGTLTTLDTVWGAAIFRNFLGERSFQILTGDEDKRREKLAKPSDFYIINPDGIKVGAFMKRGVTRLEGFAKELADRKDIQIIIIDEATAFKDHTSGRSRLLRQQFIDRQYTWLLTGTPTNTAPTDAYGLAKIVNNAYNKSFTGFRAETMHRIENTFIWKPVKDGYEKARQLLTPAVRFTLDEIWDGPPMTFQRRQIPLTPEQNKMLQDLKRDLAVAVKGGQTISAANEAAARWKYLQIVLGAVYDEKHTVHRVDASPRYKEALDVINSTERKVVIGVPITSIIHQLNDFLNEHWRKHKIPLRSDFINGEIVGKKRTAVIKAFESDPTLKVVLVDPIAASHGINEFVVGDTLIWFGAVDKAESWIQLNARLRRPGQKYPTTCFQFFATKTESEMFDRLEKNESMQGLMLKAIRDEKL